jgi:lysozyme family protein
MSIWQTVAGWFRTPVEASRSPDPASPPKSGSGNTNFPACLDIVLAKEGGYVDHPADPGGATNLGITFATLSAWRGHPITKADVAALTKAEAGEIYRAKYWNPTRCADLPAGLDLAVFDYGVNSGVGRPARALQKILGVPQDGVIGPVTLAAIKQRDPRELIEALCDERLRFLRSLPTWGVFGRGWTSRVEDVRVRARGMAG